MAVQQKKGKWYAVLNLKDINGKRKAKWISTGLTVRGNKKKSRKVFGAANRQILREPCGRLGDRYSISGLF